MESLLAWFASALEFFEGWGLLGVFLLMFVESSLIPFPSEAVMIPAGYLAAQGRMSFWGAILAGTAGSLSGAYFNYYLAIYLGRPFLLKYGRYFFLPPDKFLRAAEFFERHGTFGTFLCRLIPGIRQLVSLPAGLARMPHLAFASSTSLGAGIWVIFLTWAGQWFGGQIDLRDKAAAAKVVEFAKKWGLLVGACAAAIGLAYMLWAIKNDRNKSDSATTNDSATSAEPKPQVEPGPLAPKSGPVTSE